MKNQINLEITSVKTNIFKTGWREKSRIAFTFLILMALMTSCLDQSMETVSDIQEDFQNIKKIEVDGASLKVIYLGQQGKATVTLDALVKSNISNGYKIDYFTSGDKLIVTVKKNGGNKWNRRSEGHIYLTGPQEMELDLEVGSGHLEAENVSADEISLKVGSGELIAKNLEADLIRLASSSGILKAQNLKGEVEVSISSGEMTISQVEGNVKAEGSSGKMKFNQIEGLVNASISSGEMEMQHIQALGHITLSSGKVVAMHSGLSSTTYLKASSGTFSIQTESNLNAFNFDFVTGSGSARVGASQSKGSLKIHNGSPYTIIGDIGSGKIEILN